MKRLLAVLALSLAFALPANAWDHGVNPGVNLVPGDPATTAWFDDGTTTTTGTSVNGLPAPAVVVGTGAYFNVRELFEFPSSGYVAGKPVTTNFWFTFGTSGSIYAEGGDGTNGFSVMMNVGGSPTLTNCGGYCLASAANYGSYEVLTVMWYPSTAAYFDIGLGPNTSSTSTNVIFYQATSQQAM